MMRHAICLGVIGLTLLAPACRRSESRLPRGADLGGLEDVGEAEEYVGASLYSYMDGGAEIFNEYGFTRLFVRRYRGANRERIVELYEMRDPGAAAGLYSYMRREGTERELAGECHGSLAETEVKLVKGGFYLVCRGDDPLVNDSDALRDMCARIGQRLNGTCDARGLFASLPTEGRIQGSEIALAGPIGLNVRPWLVPLSRDGFKRGWLASYNTKGGRIEGFLAEFSGAALAMKTVRAIPSTPTAAVAWRADGSRIALAHGPAASVMDRQKTCELLLQSHR